MMFSLILPVFFIKYMASVPSGIFIFLPSGAFTFRETNRSNSPPLIA